MKLSLSKLAYSKPDNKRDISPLMTRNTSSNIIVTNAIPQTSLEAFKRKIQKRNNRTNSFGVYNITESCITKDKSYLTINTKQHQASNKKPLIVKMKQFTLNKIPAKKHLLMMNKCQLTYSIDNKQLMSSDLNNNNLIKGIKDNSPFHCLNSSSLCLHSNNNKQNLTYSNDDLSTSLDTQNTKKRIQLIEEGITTLLQEPYPQKAKQMIIKEFDSMIRRMSETYGNTNLSSNGYSSSYSESIRERLKLKEENEAMKSANRLLLDRVDSLETKFDLLFSEKEQLQEYFTRKVDKIDEMSMLIDKLNNDIVLLQKEKRDNDRNKIVNANESLDDIDLISNQVNGISNIDQGDVNINICNANDKNPKAKLDFHLITKEEDFNDEFLRNYKEFSPSWRKATDQMLQRQNKRKAQFH